MKIAEYLKWAYASTSKKRTHPKEDQKTLKKLGLVKKEGSLIFPGDESFPSPPIGYRVTFIDHLIRGLSTPIHEFLRGLLFVYGIQLHQLTPNSILHISIFITLCKCFLGTHPHWGLWKRIFYLRHNSSRNVAYNVGGVVICVRPEVDYFDVKFPDSVQGWRRRWLYVQEEYNNSQEYNIAPFDGAAKIPRRRSWDAKATVEERTTTDALMKRIHELQNTHGEELLGVQITAYFLRIRVQPLQARKNPHWIYAGEKDVDRLSKDLSVKDLEKLIRLLSSLSKKHDVPTTCRVEPYSCNHALPENHQVLSSLPPLPEGGEVDERAVVTDDSQEPSRPESGAAGSHKSAASSEKSESDASKSVRSPPSAVSPKSKRKRDEVEDSGTSKPTDPTAEETPPEEEGAFNPYDDAGSVSSHLIKLWTQFIGYRDADEDMRENLDRAEKHAEELAAKLERSEKAREKAEQEATTVEDLRQRLHKAENALSDKVSQQIARVNAIIARLETQNRQFVRKMGEDFTLHEAEEDRLLDTLSILELHGDLARTNISDVRAAFTRLFPHFFPKQTQPQIFSELVRRFLPQEDLALAYRQENLKVGVEGTIALVADSRQDVEWAKVGNPKGMNKEKWKTLVKAAKPHSKKILAFLGHKPAASASTAKPKVK
ncbi:hypothetical protein QYE76_060215 [Lolium multiflorum]|uniref:Transposase (putative) gypsy type domain-containing protein n=1 Tax=Lolium multiflorum TaxID=4521 RepID=A0AAD8W558_LOLMU|nr:hypothetical protein QYE76_060215 [Lolium multiflorum]